MNRIIDFCIFLNLFSSWIILLSLLRVSSGYPLNPKSPEIGRPMPKYQKSCIEVVALNSAKKNGNPHYVPMQKRSPIPGFTKAELQVVKEHDRGRRDHFNKIIEQNAEKWRKEHKD
jgi:hypothetical protein